MVTGSGFSTQYVRTRLGHVITDMACSAKISSGRAVRVEIPVPVVDALLSGDGDVLNVRAALQELSQLRGELVRVIETDSNIRIWIDESPAQ